MKKSLLLLGIMCCLGLANPLDQIKDSKVLRVGVLKSNPPFSKFQDGVFEGFEIEFAKAISKDLIGENAKIEFVGLEMSERFSSLQENRVDMTIANITMNPDRAKLVDFTTPYFSVNLAVATKKSDNIQKMSDLAEKTILVEKGTDSDKYFNKIGYKTKLCSARECYNMLKSGQGDGYSSNNIITSAYPIIDQSLEIKVKNIGEALFISIAVQKGNDTLLNFLNEELIKLSKDGFFRKKYDEIIAPFYKGTIDKGYFLLEDLYNVIG